MASPHHPMPPAAGSSHRAVPWMLLLVDAVLVIVFAAMGNRNHATGLAVTDVLQTAAPFLVALLLSSLAVRFWRSPSKLWPDVVVVILGTLGLGMVLRVISGTGGAQWSFVLVAAAVLGSLLLIRRILSGLLLRRKIKSFRG